MKLIRLWIDDFKNLQDVTVQFDSDPERLLSVVIGWNGTGKSNLIEALVIIFRDLDLGENPSLKFKLVYECRGRLISVNSDPDRKSQQVKFSYQEEEKQQGDKGEYGPRKSVAFSKFKDGGGRDFLPKYVFGYYSGPSNRLAKHFEKHQHKFYSQLIYPEKYGIDSTTIPLRPLFYARLIHSQFVLLPFFLDEDPLVKKFLEEQLGIIDLDSILFVMHNPS